MALLAALNLYAAYAANIVALLQSTTNSIRTLKDLLDSPLSLGAHDTVFNHYYFGSFKVLRIEIRINSEKSINVTFFLRYLFCAIQKQINY